VNAQELFLDVSSGRFLDGESAIPTTKPIFYSDEQKRVKLSIRKVANNKVSAVSPSANSKYKFRLGTPTAKLADGIDVSTTPPALLTALAQVVTVGATQATGIALLSNYTATTAVIRADVSQVTAVTATITIGISASTSFVSTFSLLPKTVSPSIVGYYFSDYRPYLGAVTFGSPLRNVQQLRGFYPFGSPLPIILAVTASLNTVAPAQFTTSFTSGSVSTIGITNRGAGYPNGTFALTFSGGGATAGTITATATAVASGGIIISVNLASSGSGYASAPIASLFTPEKQVDELFVTNFLGNVGVNKKRFYWAYATTSVSTPIVPINFSAPNATSTTAPLSVPSAFITSVTENIWELTFVSGGYGYTSTPTVTHNAALVSTSKFSSVVTFSDPNNPFRIIADFSGQAYIKNGGLAVRYRDWISNSTKYFRPTKEFSGVWGRQNNINSEATYVQQFLAKPGNLVNPNPTISPTIPAFYEVKNISERATNPILGRQITYYPNKAKTDSLGNLTYEEAKALFGGESTILPTWNNGKLLEQTFSDFIYAAAVTPGYGKSALFKISTAPLNPDYNVVYGDITINRGGGVYEPSIEIVDFGEGYAPNYNNDSTLELSEMGALAPQVLIESATAVTVSITGGVLLDTPLSYNATVATQTGRLGTQYVIKDGGLGYYSRPIAVISSLPVATGGIVTTARITNTPQAYGDGEYDCTIQSPSVGTAANIKLIFESGVGRAVILDGGAGYTSAPIVTAPAPNLRTGIIENAIVTNRPQGYEIGKTYLLETQSSPITGGNCSLSLANTQNGYVVQIVDGGFGYSSSPIVTAPSPDLPQGIINFIQTTTQGQGYADGTYDCSIQVAPSGGKTLKAVFQKDGTQGTFNVLEQGYGYTTAPIVSVATPAGNLINGITITCGGTFYQDDSIQFKVNDGSGADAIFNTPSICGGIVKSISVLNKGYGYSDTPTIVFDAPQAPIPTSLQRSQVEGDINITVASANAILSTSTQRDILLEVFETDGTNEQVVAQATVSLAKRVLE
jgi:hypothetical protein